MVYFREEQRFRQPWLWALMLAGPAVIAFLLYRQSVGQQPAPNGVPLAVAALVLLMPAWMYCMRLVTEVHEDAVVLRFVLLWKRKVIPFGEIRRAEPVTYRPLIDYGGWGIRRGRNGWAYNVSGNRGVRLELANGSDFLIGSQQPEELARAIQERLAVNRC